MTAWRAYFLRPARYIAGATYSIIDRLRPSSTTRTGPVPGVDAGPWRSGDLVITSRGPLPGPMPPFGHEDLTAPQARLLREQIGELIADRPDPLELTGRIRALADHGRVPQVTKLSDPAAILQLARQGQPLDCRAFCLVLGAALHMLGYTTRLLGISRLGHAAEHAVLEVYWPALGKWVLLDPDFNLAYRAHDQWLNAAELQQYWLAVRQTLAPKSRDLAAAHRRVIEQVHRGAMLPVEVRVLSSAGEALRQSNLSGPNGTETLLEFYEHIVYSQRNDYLTRRYWPGHPRATGQTALCLGSQQPRPAYCPEATPAASPADVNWPVGRTRAVVEVIEPHPAGWRARTRLGTDLPNFTNFEVQIADGPWQAIEGQAYEWVIKRQEFAGSTPLRCRAINSGGLAGETSELHAVS